jgi:hypothetical protein
MINISNKDALTLARLLPTIIAMTVKHTKSTRELNAIRVQKLIVFKLHKKLLQQ